MRRVLANDRRVHFFAGGGNFRTLCGVPCAVTDLTGSWTPCVRKTTEAVTCPDCGRLYNEIKNAPWNEVEDKCLADGLDASSNHHGDCVRCDTAFDDSCPWGMDGQCTNQLLGERVRKEAQYGNL